VVFNRALRRVADSELPALDAAEPATAASAAA
jgi:hypothetical protein